MKDRGPATPLDSLGNVPLVVVKPRVFSQEVFTSGLST